MCEIIDAERGAKPRPAPKPERGGKSTIVGGSTGGLRRKIAII